MRRTWDKKIEYREKIRPREDGWLQLEVSLDSTSPQAFCKGGSALSVTQAVLVPHSLFMDQILSLTHHINPQRSRKTLSTKGEHKIPKKLNQFWMQEGAQIMHRFQCNCKASLSWFKVTFLELVVISFPPSGVAIITTIVHNHKL